MPLDGNEALRQAQRVLRLRADAIPDEEVARDHWEPSKVARGLRMAADILEELMIDDRPLVLVNDCDHHEPRQHRDGREPWCNYCGLNAQGQKPQGGVRPPQR